MAPQLPSWAEVQETLLSPSGAPVTSRYRALFTARSAAPCPSAAAELLQKAFPFSRDSVLLRHEFAYLLGQLGESSSVPLLRQTAEDDDEDEVVRHEAVEALAALEAADALPLIERLQDRSGSEALRHTCELAASGLRAGAKEVCACQYASRDPAAGWSGATAEDVPRAASLLRNAEKALSERYEGLFTLRNVGGEPAAEALAAALREDGTSAVLRHEVAFVLGQMEAECACAALAASLACEEEHGMVRHEAAIALGSIGSEKAEEALRAQLLDREALVAESCAVALETAAYWRAWEELEARIAAQKDED